MSAREVFFRIGGQKIRGVDLKCLLVSQGVKCERAVYRRFGEDHRLHVNPLTCNCLILSDGTICQMTDVGFHLEYLNGALSWDNLKLLRYASELGTPFSVKILDDQPALFHKGDLVDYVRFAPKSEFYRQKTTSGLPFMGNAVLQGLDWLAFQCLWPCEYAAAGKPCQFCFSGAEFEALAKKKRKQPDPLDPSDVADIAAYARKEEGVRGLQITGGSTFSGILEADLVQAYLEKVQELGLEEILLYITPPKDRSLLDRYFDLGASRIACSLEVWDEKRARTITPGKMDFTTRQAQLGALQYVADRYGPNKAFSNLIIGLEPLESLKEGASWLAQRGIIPTASVWMPMGRPVMGTMKAPSLDYFQRAVDLLVDLYGRYGLEPAGFRGLNVCIEADINRLAGREART